MTAVKSLNALLLLLVGTSAAGRAQDAAPARATDSEVPAQLEAEFGASTSEYQVSPTLSPEEMFHRIPLNPPMSEANWLKWAGPMLDKRYRVQRGDTLWAISEKLFGTPYLWPKIWQLNAVFGNAHLIEPGMELRFNPGNPNAAPGLAFDLAKQAKFAYGDLNVSFAPLTLLERLEATLNAQSDGKLPPFRAFLTTNPVPTIGKMPANPGDHLLYEGGETFDSDLQDGTYSVVRWEKFKKISGYRVFWVGVVNILDGKGYVAKAFTEIRKGDLITPRFFLLSPMAIHEEKVGEDKRGEFQIIPVEEGFRNVATEYMTVGLRFKYDDAGPQPGALLNLMHRGTVVGKALLVDRDRRSGTLWVIDNRNEVTGDYELE